LDTLKAYLTDIQAILLKEKYPTGVSQRQRVLEMEEAELTNVNGYSYFDNGDFQARLANGDSSESDQSSFSGQSPTHSTTHRKKVGKRLVLHETDE
jgi:carnitine O-acetyltransferase